MCGTTGRLSAYVGYMYVNAWHPFVFLTILQNMQLGEWWAQMCGNPALCLKPKCVFCLSLTLPKGSDQPVTDTSFFRFTY